MAQMEGKPIRRAPEESCNPIAAEMAMRVPAYEPGPSPTIIVLGPPNFFLIALRFSKKGEEFFRSLGHSCASSTSPSSQARLPRAVESSSARVFMKRNRPLSFRFYLKVDPARLFGNQFREAISPFDHSDSIAKKVIIKAKSREGLLIFNTKKIEMINRESPSSIFMQDGERGARHIRTTAQPGDDTFDEQRLTAPQVSFESQNRSDTDILRNLPPDCFGFSWTVGNERSHLSIADCQPRRINFLRIAESANQYASAPVSEIYGSTFFATVCSRAAEQ